MVSRRHIELTMASLIILTGAVFMVLALPIYSRAIGDAPGAGVFPFWVAGLLFGAGLGYLIAAARGIGREAFWAADGAKWRLSNTLGSMALYVLLMPVLGFAASTLLFLGYQFWRIGGYPILISLVSAAVLAFVVSFGFRGLLFVPLPRGPFGW